jgi:uncharacterized protein (TIGR00369 family)
MAESSTWATRRLDALIAGTVVPLPPVVETLRLGTLSEWRPGWVRKLWQPSPEIMNVDGSLFGGYIAALADQVLSFAALTVVPEDKVFRTTNLVVNFIRVGKAEPLTIEGRVVAQTKQMITVRATFQRSDGELTAEASAQQLLQNL